MATSLEPFESLRGNDSWPKSIAILDSGKWGSVPDKTRPEGAVMFAHADKRVGRLVLQWAVFLPTEELRLYQKLDQSAIYLLIAGTYTPIMVQLLTGRLRRVLLGGIWLMAAVGIACMWLLPKALHSVTVGLYLGMGWFGMLGMWQYFVAVHWRGMSWAIAGAALYTFGAVCELTRWPVIWPGVVQSHEVLHLSDMLATYCHVVFILRYVIAYRPSPAPYLRRESRSYVATAFQPE